MHLFKYLALCVPLVLAGCNLSTESPLFSPADASELPLRSGYYAMPTGGAAYMKVLGGKLIVSTDTDDRLAKDAIAVDVGSGIYLLQYGPIDAQERSYVLFRLSSDGRSIETAVYDCSRFTPFFEGFGLSVTVPPGGGCALGGATRENMLRSQRTLARILPSDAWVRVLTQ